MNKYGAYDVSNRIRLVNCPLFAICQTYHFWGKNAGPKIGVPKTLMRPKWPKFKAQFRESVEEGTASPSRPAEESGQAR